MPEKLGDKLETIAGIELTAFGVSFGLPIAIIHMAARRRQTRKDTSIIISKRVIWNETRSAY
jgi:hypothetical protein